MESSLMLGLQPSSMRRISIASSSRAGSAKESKTSESKARFWIPHFSGGIHIIKKSVRWIHSHQYYHLHRWIESLPLHLPVQLGLKIIDKWKHSSILEASLQVTPLHHLRNNMESSLALRLWPSSMKSAGFQPEPLLTAHSSLLTTHCSQLIAQSGTSFQPVVFAPYQRHCYSSSH